jgi:hypothetical protein
VCSASTRARARSPIACRSRSGTSRSSRRTSAGPSASAISRPGASTLSIPSQRSLTIGVPQAAASNSRTLGDQPAAIMSARVTLSVQRWRL